MTAQDIEAAFTRSDGAYAFARWGRPIVPVVFGVDDTTLGVIKGAFEAVCALAGHAMADTDPELGANCMMFFVRDWAELAAVPNLDRLVPDLAALLARLEAAGANQYRIFRFGEAGGIGACFVFLRMDEHLGDVPADTLALSQAVQSMLLWSENAFGARSPLAVADNTTVLRPDIAALIRAAYDPVMPAMARDPSHALRLLARMERPQ